MTHDELVERLNDFLDGSLEEAESRAMTAHLKECDVCRGHLDELRALQQEARSLPLYEPPEEIWERIRARVPQERAPRAGSSWRSTSKTAVWLAAAAGLFVATGLWLLVRDIGSAPPTVADQDELVTMVTEELRAAESHYQKAIDGLEEIIARNQGVLPPELNAVLDDNLALIEGAIEESRRAISTEPNSSVAQESLLSALRRKVSLLQNTILLINEVRKGEGENALDLIEEIRDTKPSPNPI